MSTTRLEKLISIGSDSLSDEEPMLEWAASQSTTLLAELLHALRSKNGFFAFESALHVFPSTTSGEHIGLREWNIEETWRYEYGDLAAGCIFFAQDLFGNQFAVTQHEICTFDAETGERVAFADSLEEWAGTILADYNFHTGYPLAHDWQVINGPLQPTERLMPKTPFVTGGKFEVDNLLACNAVLSMQLRGQVARQVRDLPDGTKIQIEFE